MVDRGGRGVVRQAVEHLRVVVLADEAAHRADGGQRHLARERTVVAVAVDLVLRVLQIGDEQAAAHGAHRLQQVAVVFRDDGRDLVRRPQPDTLERIVRSPLVGDVVERVVAVFHGDVVIGEAGQQNAEPLLADVPSDATTKSHRPSFDSQAEK